MHEPERRLTERFNAEDFTYISFGADNGGSVLNLSADGLCFSSISPIHKNGPLRVWFSNLRQRVETEAEIVWVGQSQKTGGMRFIGLSDEAREKIRTWNDRSVHTEPVRKDPITPMTRMGLHTAHPTNGGPPIAPPGTLSEAAGREALVSVDHLAGAQSSQRMSAFSRGLLTGLLVSAVFGGVLLFHSHRGEIGEMLIHLGEQVATKPQPEVEAAAPTATASIVPPLQSNRPVSQPSKLTAPAPEKAAPAPEPDVVKIIPSAKAAELDTTPKPKPPAATSPALAASTNTANATTPKLPPPAPAQNAASAAQSPAKSSVGSATQAAASSAQIQTAAASKPPAATIVPVNKAAAPAPAPVLTATKAPAPDLTPRPETHSDVSSVEFGSTKAGPPPQMFFEVGKFKNSNNAQSETDRIAKLGLPSEVQQKGRLFGNSYVVLVGPYKDDATAEVAHTTLATNDIKALPFERGARTMEFRSGVNVNGSNTAGGDCEIKWESYPNEATVKFFQRGLVVATAKGKWVTTDSKNSQDAIVIRRNPDGSRTLLEVRFAGMKRTLVLGKSS
jgi:hypothetical protein